MSGGRLPDYQLKALHKGTDEKASVGGAWINEDGTISIRLNNFVVLNGTSDLVLTLFPRLEKPRGRTTD